MELIVLTLRHLARFSFTPTDSSSVPIKVEVFSPDPSATRPFFSATITPINYTPSFPFSSAWLSYLGMSSHLLQPPLPEGDPADVVIRTENLLRSHPILKSRHAKLVWFDTKQPENALRDTGIGDAEGDALLVRKGNENWWPGMRRWQLGIYCPDATLTLGEPEIL